MDFKTRFWEGFFLGLLDTTDVIKSINQLRTQRYSACKPGQEHYCSFFYAQYLLPESEEFIKMNERITQKNQVILPY